MEDEFDLYDTLNVPRDASNEEVRGAFRDLSRLYHPDKQAGAVTNGLAGAGSTNGGEAAFMRVLHAYRVLSDDTMRQFYDRYGLSGVRMAETLSDEEPEAGINAGQIVSNEDKLKHLEDRVRRLMRKHEELRMQRLLALQGSFVLSLASSPGPHGAHLRRRYRVHYTAISQSVQVCLSDSWRLTTGCTGHVQGANGVGASKLMLAVAGRLGSLMSCRGALNLVGPGSAVEGEASISRQLSSHLSAQQRFSVAANGACALSVGFQCWLREKLHGSLEFGFGDGPGLSMNLIRKGASARHKMKSSLRLQPGSGEVGMDFKTKPSKDFSLTISPSISPQGWLLNFDCSKRASDGLSKLHWILRLKRCGVSLRLGFSRAGVRFSIPIELWPESSGPLPLPELCLAVSLWALPPLLLRLCANGRRKLAERWSRGKGVPASTPPLPDVSPSVASAAAEQRRLLAPKAARRRQEESASGGLEILAARYGDPRLIEDESSPERKVDDSQKVIDVADCLMAWVRSSRLELSDKPKSSLIGFYDISRSCGCKPVLFVQYRFGTAVHSQTFGDTEAIILP